MKIIISVFNNLLTDQRVEKVCQTLKDQSNFDLLLIGNSWTGLPKMNRSYPFFRIALQSKVLRLAYLEFQWKLYRKLLQEADAKTILLSNDLDTLLPNYLVAKKLNIPLVFDSHEIFTEMPAINGRFTQKIWRTLESFVLPKLKYMMTASESYALWFQKTYQIELPVVVRNYPKYVHQNISEADAGAEKVVLYQGVINPFRGLDQLIPQMQKVKAKLWIAGDGPRRAEYELLAKTHQVDHLVKFLGKLSPEDLRILTRRADVGLSIEENQGLSYYFSLPNKISDYIQARVPVVVSDFPEMKKVVENFPVGEKIQNYNQLPEQINKVLLNGKAYYSEGLEAAAKEMSWENEAPKIVALFQKVVRENF